MATIPGLRPPLDPELDAAIIHRNGPRGPRQSLYAFAKAAGWAAYRHTGAVYLPELVILGVNRCLRNADGESRAFYDNNRRINLRRHVFLLGPKDTKKGSIIEMWRRIFPVIHYADHTPGEEADGLVEMTAQGRTTWESIVGGAQDGQLILPSAVGTHFLTIEEGMSFFGHNKQSMMRQVDNFNGALQEGDVVNDVKNMKGGSMKVKNEFAEECARHGIIFNPHRGVMKFTFTQSTILASREPDFDAWASMLDSGFISRLAVADCHFDPIVEEEYYRNDIGDADEAEPYLRKMREMVETLWSCTFTEVNSPDLELTNIAIDEIITEYLSICEDTGLRLDDIKSGRERQYLAQVMTFNAAQRLLADGLRPGTVVPRLEYTAEDAEYALAHFRQYMLPYINRRAHQAIGKKKDSKHIEEIRRVLRAFIDKLDESSNDMDTPAAYQEFDSRALVDFYADSEGKAPSTVHARIGEMEEIGLVTVIERRKHNLRIFRVRDSFIEKTCRKMSLRQYYEREAEMFSDYESADYFRKP